MRDPQKTARVLTAGLFGAISGWLIGGEGADLTAGVIEPVMAQLKAAKAHHTPGSLRPGPVWHSWIQHQSYWPTHWLSLLHHPDLVLGAVGLGLVTGGFLACQAHKARPLAEWGGPQAAGKGQHGTAHWRDAGSLGHSYTHWQAPLVKDGQHQRLKTMAEMRQTAHDIAQKWERQASKVKTKNKAPQAPVLFPPAGVLVGTDTRKNPQAGWILAQDQHVLIAGDTGSGKSRRLFIPTMGIMGTAATESLIISDVKGELYDHTAAWLQSRGYQVIRLDLIDAKPGRSQRYNPIAPVWTALHQNTGPDLAAAAKMARQVAHLITYGSGGSVVSTDPLWINGQISLTSAVILLVADGSHQLHDCHLHAVYRVLVEKGSENEGKALDALFAGLPGDHPARMAYATYQLAQGKTRASIITTTAAGLQLWGDPDIAWVTAKQDHDLAQIGQRPTAVFLVIPFEDKSRYTAAALYVSMVFQTLTDLSRRHQGRLPCRVTFLLDEMGNLPPFPDFDQFVTVCRSMGIRLVLALQNLEQLKKHYAHTERTIRGNLGTWLFLRTSDLQTAKELSEMMGRYTTQSESSQMPKVSLMSMSTNMGHTSQGLSLTGRELVTADELMRWPQDTVLVWQAGFPPAKLPLPDLSAWHIFPDLQQRQAFKTLSPPPSPDPTHDDRGDPSPLQGEDEPDPQKGEQKTMHTTQPPEESVDIPAETLGVMADLFASQTLPIDFTDVPPHNL